MARPTLILTHALPPNVMAHAEHAFTLRMPGKLRLRDWLPTATPGADAILCVPGFRFDAAIIAALPPSIRAIGTFSVGTDHIDLDAARARDIAVLNTPSVLNQATAEFTMALILAAARRIGEAERLLRAGAWQGWTTAGLLGTDVSGKSLGIFGMGRIGQTLARIARLGFNMPIHYRNRTRLPPELEQGAIFHDHDATFLAVSQILCLLAPATPDTTLWLNAARLAQLPVGAIVVNTARGALVDDQALAAALTTRHIAAAALDVFPKEPKIPEIYLTLQNVVLTPHIATATAETRDSMGFTILKSLKSTLTP